MSAGLAAIVVLLPEPAPTLAPQVAANIAATGLGNPVTAVLMAYRAIDTLLETVVLLLALLGIWSLAPDRIWGGFPGVRHDADPHGLLTFIAQFLAPVGILVGIHIFWVGSVAPGGEFQAATILAAMWILATMAGLVDAPPVSRRRLRILLVAGPAVFFAIGLAGLAMAGAFLAYPAPYAKLIILMIEIPVTLSIAATLGAVGGWPAATGAATMSSATLYGLCGAVLVGLGLFGLIVHPQPLRKILAFNLIGSGVFLLFGVVARRGAAAGFGGDPVPQALVITGLVVAFAATALAVALLLRLFEQTGQADPAVGWIADPDAEFRNGGRVPSRPGDRPAGCGRASIGGAGRAAGGAYRPDYDAGRARRRSCDRCRRLAQP